MSVPLRHLSYPDQWMFSASTASVQEMTEGPGQLYLIAK